MRLQSLRILTLNQQTPLEKSKELTDSLWLAERKTGRNDKDVLINLAGEDTERKVVCYDVEECENELMFTSAYKAPASGTTQDLRIGHAGDKNSQRRLRSGKDEAICIVRCR
uniref:DNA topoisomerase (ATP-hydrolyzing) n=1 Tax=Ascaris lumbricoides TaxID=6252 RepID=A0A0M3HZS7_ASCLU